MRPDVFNRIEFRRIGWQGKRMDSSVQAGQEILQEAAAMRGLLTVSANSSKCRFHRLRPAISDKLFQLK
jgi:hypothetical protein